MRRLFVYYFFSLRTLVTLVVLTLFAFFRGPLLRLLNWHGLYSVLHLVIDLVLLRGLRGVLLFLLAVL